MRLLFFVQGNAVEDQIGFDVSFRTILSEGGLSDYLAFPWRGFVQKYGWPEFFNKAVALSKEFCPDAIYLQFFHETDCPDVTDFIGVLKRLPGHPIVAVSSGDPFSWNGIMQRKYPLGFISAARAADLTFNSSMGRCADYLVKKGVRNIVLLPLGACPVRFNPNIVDPRAYNPEFDVIFIGNGGWRCKNPRYLTFWSARKRAYMVGLLQKRYGKRFGLFGNGWKGISSWQGSVSFAEQIICCHRAQVVFGGCPGSNEDYYTSDRPFIQGSSGIPLVDWYLPRVDKLLRDQEHWYLVRDGESLLRQIDRLLAADVDVRLRKGAETAGYIQHKFSQVTLMRFFVRTVSTVLAARRTGTSAPPPEIDFLLPEVDVEKERDYALRNWQG